MTPRYCAMNIQNKCNFFKIIKFNKWSRTSTINTCMDKIIGTPAISSVHINLSTSTLTV